MLFLFSIVFCYAQPERPVVFKVNRFQITVHKVLDADTLQATIHLGWDVSLEKKMIRCLDFDAWETSHKRGSVVVTDEEIQKGIKAREALIDLLSKSIKAYVEPGPEYYDNYGRVLGRIFLESKDGKITELSKFMKENGHIRPSKYND